MRSNHEPHRHPQSPTGAAQGDAFDDGARRIQLPPAPTDHGVGDEGEDRQDQQDDADRRDHGQRVLDGARLQVAVDEGCEGGERSGSPMIDGMPKSARFPTAINTNDDSSAGRSRGIVTEVSARTGPAPPTRAACSRSVGIRRNAAETMSMAMG